MTKEQEEAIERLSLKSITSSALELKDYPNMICFKKDVIEVLNMLKENSAEIEQKNSELAEKNAEIEELKQVLARNIAKNFTSSMKESAKSKEDLEMLNAGWQIELEKKDKIIDLTVDLIYEISKVYPGTVFHALTYNGFDLSKCDGSCQEKFETCKDCIKQYFESKVEE